jgi:hypothetical protein
MSVEKVANWAKSPSARDGGRLSRPRPCSGSKKRACQRRHTVEDQAKRASLLVGVLERNLSVQEEGSNRTVRGSRLNDP